MRVLLAVAAGLAMTGNAHAHGFAGPGWLHPLTGPDHMLAMLAVGAWSAQIGGRAIYGVPAAFVAAMACGGALGLAGIALPGTEIGIALSVLMLGLAIATRTRLSLVFAMGATCLFGLCHGYAHGLEMPRAADALSYGAGFLATTAALHVFGAVGAMLIMAQQRGALALRLSGLAAAGAGAMFLWPLL
jgi:urease accessory protein